MAVNWTTVTSFFESAIEESEHLEVRVYSPELDEAIEVVVPKRSVEDFMKGLPLFEANVTKGRN